MKEVKVCIGSACHIKGSYDVIEIIQELIECNDLTNRIKLSAAFCMGLCTKAVSVMRWDGEVFSFSKDNAHELFSEFIKKLNEEQCDVNH